MNTATALKTNTADLYLQHFRLVQHQLSEEGLDGGARAQRHVLCLRDYAAGDEGL